MFVTSSISHHVFCMHLDFKIYCRFIHISSIKSLNSLIHYLFPILLDFIKGSPLDFNLDIKAFLFALNRFSNLLIQFIQFFGYDNKSLSNINLHSYCQNIHFLLIFYVYGEQYVTWSQTVVRQTIAHFKNKLISLRYQNCS